MRIGIFLPGLHVANRGAEVAFEALGRHLADDRTNEVTLFGSGPARSDEPYRYVRSDASVRRERFERWPKFPPMRTEFVYEELTWMPGLLRKYRPCDFDVTVTCSYPFTNWLLRSRDRGHWPAHVFVTENGDWAPSQNRLEYRFFGADGLVCTNPDYFERNRGQWFSELIPNGVDSHRFTPGNADPTRFGLPVDKPVILMVSALNPNKRVLESMRAVAQLDDAWLVVAGDGSQRREVDQLAAEVLPGRFKRLTVPSDEMPELYRCADVFLHVSLYESFGNVFIEAMASGLKVVVHDFSVTQWIVGGDGVLIDMTQEAHVVKALGRALCSGSAGDASMVNRTTERFDWRRIAEQYQVFFEQILHNRGRKK